MPYRIVLVEDHPVMRRAYAQLLKREADLALCGTAESAEEALAILAETSCDLVLTDLMLPGMDGIALIERLRTEHPGLPAVVISAHDAAVFAQRAEAAGARAFVSKEDLYAALVPTLRRVLAEQGSAADQESARSD